MSERDLWPSLPRIYPKQKDESLLPKKQDPSYQRFEYAGTAKASGPMHAAKEPPKPDPVASSQNATTGGRKFDGGKLEYGLMPPLALEENVKVLTFGAQKYERDNWKRVPDAKRRYYDAALRHLWAYKRGEDLDPESGIHHLAHALCCIEFILDLELSPTEENPK
jgi:hypothetical protein